MIQIFFLFVYDRHFIFVCACQPHCKVYSQSDGSVGDGMSRHVWDSLKLVWRLIYLLHVNEYTAQSLVEEINGIFVSWNNANIQEVIQKTIPHPYAAGQLGCWARLFIVTFSLNSSWLAPCHFTVGASELICCFVSPRNSRDISFLVTTLWSCNRLLVSPTAVLVFKFYAVACGNIKQKQNNNILAWKESKPFQNGKYRTSIIVRLNVVVATICSFSLTTLPVTVPPNPRSSADVSTVPLYNTPRPCTIDRQIASLKTQ